MDRAYKDWTPPLQVEQPEAAYGQNYLQVQDRDNYSGSDSDPRRQLASAGATAPAATQQACSNGAGDAYTSRRLALRAQLGSQVPVDIHIDTVVDHWKMQEAVHELHQQRQAERSTRAAAEARLSEFRQHNIRLMREMSEKDMRIEEQLKKMAACSQTLDARTAECERLKTRLNTYRAAVVGMNGLLAVVSDIEEG